MHSHKVLMPRSSDDFSQFFGFHRLRSATVPSLCTHRRSVLTYQNAKQYTLSARFSIFPDGNDATCVLSEPFTIEWPQSWSAILVLSKLQFELFESRERSISCGRISVTVESDEAVLLRIMQIVISTVRVWYDVFDECQMRRIFFVVT